MITLTAAEARRRFGELSEMVQREPVQVTKNGRESYYVLSSDEYERLCSEVRSTSSENDDSPISRLRAYIETNLEPGDRLDLPEPEPFDSPTVDFNNARFG